MPSCVIGIDIGGTKTAVILAKKGDVSSSIIEKMVFPTESKLGFPIWEKKVEDNISILLFEHGYSRQDITSIGFSCGSPMSSKEGIIIAVPNLPGFENIHIVDIFKEKYGCPCFIVNDANACALAEYRYGAGRGYKNLMFCTFGTGFGAGLILDGKLYSGNEDMAGEVGHIRLSQNGPVGYGKKGSVEGYCSGAGIAYMGKTKAKKALEEGKPLKWCTKEEDIEKISAKLIAEYARKGDKDAIDIYRVSGTKLGEFLSIAIDFLNPEAIIIGSIYERCEDLLYPYAKEVIDREAVSINRDHCKILKAELGDRIGDYAAVSVALDGLEQKNG